MEGVEARRPISPPQRVNKRLTEADGRQLLTPSPSCPPPAAHPPSLSVLVFVAALETRQSGRIVYVSESLASWWTSRGRKVGEGGGRHLLKT